MGEYLVITFRSRTQVMYFNKLMNSSGIPTEIINTPHEVSVGCGLSVKTYSSQLNAAKRIFNSYRPDNLVGMYYYNGKRIIGAAFIP